jgi:hypothetical protein
MLYRTKKKQRCNYCTTDAVKRTVVQGRLVHLCPACLAAFRRLRSAAPWKVTHEVLRAECERRKVWGTDASR